MSKVIGINGSPRKNWNSAKVLDAALEGAKEKGADVKRYDLIDLTFSGCRSCFACKLLGGKSFGKCITPDDLKPVLEEMLSADAVLISTPIYFGDVTGMVRNLFERFWFPSLMYRKDGTIAYETHPKVGLIYTMNVPDAGLYTNLTSGHVNTFNRLVGETKALCITDTYQFTDYSKYSSDMFDPVHKKEHRDAQFPKDLETAKAFGASLLG